MNGKWDSQTRGSWTAVSRAPYLKALALYAQGDCWHGGGLWTGNNTYWLNTHGNYELICDSSSVQLDTNHEPIGCFGGECLGVYYPRLLRDGWTLNKNGCKVTGNDRFEKSAGGGWTLRKITHAQINHPEGKGCYWDEHELVGPDKKTVQRYPDWEWADLDGERLVWAAGGILYAGKTSRDGLVRVQKLHDFNNMTFERLIAPY